MLACEPRLPGPAGLSALREGTCPSCIARQRSFRIRLRAAAPPCVSRPSRGERSGGTSGYFGLILLAGDSSMLSPAYVSLHGRAVIQDFPKDVALRYRGPHFEGPLNPLPPPPYPSRSTKEASPYACPDHRATGGPGCTHGSMCSHRSPRTTRLGAGSS